jgi:hypothetical protein
MLWLCMISWFLRLVKGPESCITSHSQIEKNSENLGAEAKICRREHVYTRRGLFAQIALRLSPPPSELIPCSVNLRQCLGERTCFCEITTSMAKWGIDLRSGVVKNEVH